MPIRKVLTSDATAIVALLDQLQYPGTAGFLPAKIERLTTAADTALMVYEQEGKILGFIAIALIVQLAVSGDFARITYFAVDESARSAGIGRALEEYGAQFAREHHCDRIEVHCHERRVDAHRFYFRQGYTESPKYLLKKL